MSACSNCFFCKTEFDGGWNYCTYEYCDYPNKQEIYNAHNIKSDKEFLALTPETCKMYKHFNDATFKDILIDSIPQICGLIILILFILIMNLSA